MTLVTEKQSSLYSTQRFDLLYISLKEAILKADQTKIFEVFLKLQRDMIEKPRNDNYCFYAIILEAYGRYDLGALSKQNILINVERLAAKINRFYEFLKKAKKLTHDALTYAQFQSFLFTPKLEKKISRKIFDQLFEKKFIECEKLLKTIPEGDYKRKLEETYEGKIKENAYEIAQKINTKSYLEAFSLSLHMPRGVGLDSLLLRIGCGLWKIHELEKIQILFTMLSRDEKRKELEVHIQSNKQFVPRTKGLWNFQKARRIVDGPKPHSCVFRSKPQNIALILDQEKEKISSLLEGVKYNREKKALFLAIKEQMLYLHEEFQKKQEALRLQKEYRIVLLQSPLYKVYKKKEIYLIYSKLAIATSNLTSCINEIFQIKDLMIRSEFLLHVEQLFVSLNEHIKNIHRPSIREITEWFISEIYGKILTEINSEALLTIVQDQLEYMIENFEIFKLISEYQQVHVQFDLENSPIHYASNTICLGKFKPKLLDFFRHISERINDACLINESYVRIKTLEAYDDFFVQIKHRMKLAFILSGFGPLCITLNTNFVSPYQDIISEQVKKWIGVLCEGRPFHQEILVKSCKMRFSLIEINNGVSKEALKVIRETFIGIIIQMKMAESLSEALFDEFVIIFKHYLGQFSETHNTQISPS